MMEHAHAKTYCSLTQGYLSPELIIFNNLYYDVKTVRPLKETHLGPLQDQTTITCGWSPVCTQRPCSKPMLYIPTEYTLRYTSRKPALQSHQLHFPEDRISRSITVT